MPWSGQFSSAKGIRNTCRKKLCDDIFFPMKVENEWKILIVDEFALKLISSCFKTEEVMALNIAIIEILEKTREPLPYLSAIYLLHPSAYNIGFLQTDFVSLAPKYLNAHLFFLSAVSQDLFNELVKYASPGFVETFAELDIHFLPYESQIFTLNEDKLFSIFFDAYKELDIDYCKYIAKKLASFCVTLQTLPRIRYRRHFVKNFILAEALQKELSLYEERFSDSNSTYGSQPRYEILILDRGFDCISPIVHELTLQAMAHDLLEIEDDIYVHSSKQDNGEENNEISLTEDDTLWCKLRHEHIGNVAKIIDRIFETDMLLRRHSKISGFKELPELGEAVRKHLALRKNQPHALFRRMANECMKIYCSGVNVISEIEQDLALGLASGKSNSKDVKVAVLNVLSNTKYSVSEKLRILLLHVFFSNGITKQQFDDIVTNSELPFSEARIITNVLHLDVDILRPGYCKPVDYIQRDTNDSSGTLRSKWVPAIKNIMLSCVEGSLTEEKYPYLENNNYDYLKASKRTGYWCTDKKSDHMSRLIIFISGGITYSEMRSAYEVMSKHKGWEVYIGGDTILTPKKFLNKLKELRFFLYRDI